ncbi:hypothetical protein FQN57_001401 [Myotisia sp. PD_48]|nr:hypothetical protein FQN57_001401 [Myotisia sp. PD_48]
MAPNSSFVSNKDYTNAGVVIIGAGFSGLCTAINLLKNNNRNFVILEKSAGLGGTWRDNKYPGSCCDVYSHLYSYSFEQNPDWTRLFSSQEEILQYLNNVGDKYGLHRYIRYSSMVNEARWDEAERKWKTTVEVQGVKDSEFVDGYTISSDFLVSAVGQLNYPSYPSIPGIDDFKGKMVHSARWDWSYDFKGKKVGVIGNGATAVQIIPEIAPVASHLTLFQRTPNWVVPRGDIPISTATRAVFKYVPAALSRFRASIMDEREANYPIVSNPDSALSEATRAISLQLMNAQLPNRPELRAKLTPNYPPGCKRIIRSDDFFPTLARDDVTLETGRIDRITEKGIIVDGVEQEFDLIVLATGFKTVEFMHPIKVYGDGGKPLSELWTQGARALYGITVESLPNFAMLYGPNTNLGHNSIILMIEAQARYILGLINAVMQSTTRGGPTLKITPKVEVLDKFNEDLQELLSRSAFAHPNCSSWYKTEEGLVTNNWSKTVIDYQKLLSKVDWSDFNLSGAGATEFRPVTNLGRVREETLVGYKEVGLTLAGIAAIVGCLAFKAPHLFPQLR